MLGVMQKGSVIGGIAQQDTYNPLGNTDAPGRAI